MQLFPLRILPQVAKFDFIKIKKFSYNLSLMLILVSLVCIAVKGFNFGIDFQGGISIEARSAKEPELSQLRKVLNEAEIGEVVIQNFGSKKDVAIRISADKSVDLQVQVEMIKKLLADNFDYDFEYRKVDFVGPQVGDYMIRSGIIAMSLAFLAIMGYVWARFEWHFGVGVLLALAHDVILSLGFMSLTGYDFNQSTIAAILTIIGYSVNDSVVIYDRIRENLRSNVTQDINQTINLSINETLSRTTITATTTLLANLALILLGGEAIKSFSVLVFVGIFIGTYSSIFISAPILTLFRFQKFKEIEEN